MRKLILLALVFTFGLTLSDFNAPAKSLDEKLPIRGLAVAAPTPQDMDLFVRFIKEELSPAKVNLLILRVDWGYAYESHPELRDDNPLSRSDVERLVSVCRENNIRLVPHITNLGPKRQAPFFANIPSLTRHLP